MVAKERTVLAGVASVVFIAGVLLASGSILQSAVTSSADGSQSGIPSVYTPSTTSPTQAVTQATSSTESASGPSGTTSSSGSVSTGVFSGQTSSPGNESVAVCTPGSSGPITSAFSAPTKSSYTNFVPLFSSYSRMNISFYELSTGTGQFTETYTSTTASVPGSQVFTEGYAAVAFGSVGYKVAIDYAESGTVLRTTAWVLNNGTVSVYDDLGRNVTGAQAASLFEGIMYPFTFESDYQILVSSLTTSAGVRADSSSGGELGATPVSLTNYSPSVLPVHADVCSTSLTLSSYFLQTASIQGATPVISSLHLAGNLTYDYQTNEILSLSMNLTSIARAP